MTNVECPMTVRDRQRPVLLFPPPPSRNVTFSGLRESLMPGETTPVVGMPAQSEECMKPITNAVIGIAVAASLTLGAASAVRAQGKPATRVQPMSRPSTMKPPMPATAAPKTNSDAFKGIAAKLGSTPDALQSSYEAAKQANPKLSRGQFVSANMVAHNLSSKHPAITTQAILSGLQSGKSIGQTLQGLGLSAKDAEDAERQARRDAAEAQRAAQ